METPLFYFLRMSPTVDSIVTSLSSTNKSSDPVLFCRNVMKQCSCRHVIGSVACVPTIDNHFFKPIHRFQQTWFYDYFYFVPIFNTSRQWRWLILDCQFVCGPIKEKRHIVHFNELRPILSYILTNVLNCSICGVFHCRWRSVLMIFHSTNCDNLVWYI